MMTNETCADCSVRFQSLCGALDEAELLELHRIGRRRHLEPGEGIAWAGDESRICGNVLSGVLKLSAATADGREQIVGLLYPSDFIGRPYADATNFSISALTDAEICLFPRGPFEQVLGRNEAMERALLRRTLLALDEARSRMVMLSRQSAEEKIAAFLLDMAARAESGACKALPGGPITFDLPLGRGQIADVLGLTIETVSRQMTKFKAAGIIALPSVRGITIRDRAALRARAEPG
ncbi:Crp/Fnr family transcriptional regulator [Sphingomonas sp. MMS24-J13]|uniref:Crp/Fnr family transcriptional regulator n=1 Tax=Sphingomonas sp. MMS24-J13 TaxID=3238686 RepID=UPI00384CF282